MVIGIYGLIGSGKSTVACVFKKEYKFDIIDADNIAQSIICEYNIINKINEKLGTQFNINTKREVLSNFFFEDLDRMKLLESIIWPYMEKKIRNSLSENNNSIIDAAVLYSAAWNKLCNYTIYVDSNMDNIILRLKERRLSKEKIESILRIQKEIKKQKLLASYIIKNNENIKDLYIKVREIWKEIYH